MKLFQPLHFLTQELLLPLSSWALPVAAGAEEDEESEEQECCHGCQTSPQDDVDLSTA